MFYINIMLFVIRQHFIQVSQVATSCVPAQLCSVFRCEFVLRRRKLAVRNLRVPVSSEHYVSDNIWPCVIGYYVALFVDLGILGLERFILSLEAQDHIL